MSAFAASRRAVLFGLGAAAVIPALPKTAAAAPKADLWDRWTPHDPASTLTVDHGRWTGLLAKYISSDGTGVNLFDYGGVTDADRRELEGYIDSLTSAPIAKLNRDEQEALWANLYNALTIKVILDHYPVDSITDIDISPGLFSNGPWGAKLLTIDGEKVSLDDVEHRILRPIWKDERVHYMVNCASIGCPNLATEAFVPAKLEMLKEAGAKAFVNHPRGATVDKDGDLTVSSIYTWFGSDFGGEKGVVRHLVKYAEPAKSAAIEKAGEIDDDDYDWSLNDVTAKS